MPPDRSTEPTSAVGRERTASLVWSASLATLDWNGTAMAIFDNQALAFERGYVNDT